MYTCFETEKLWEFREAEWERLTRRDLMIRREPRAERYRPRPERPGQSMDAKNSKRFPPN
ncbi:hypothetical protein ACFQWB_03315 [Paenibacillus thermoaerophilus]|uniref:Uncharacterized protein n=1 Tax=Paenibacillus thermoaerophilus TaxID=1215385 RepID=A0ABW2V1U9_9BACL|nr:hypothetical protein [Paenibacillus thermoaerophilus]TMV10409.1 hypothetical protein FE781_13910 [Paenibacillus thermoaerophilus]